MNIGKVYECEFLFKSGKVSFTHGLFKIRVDVELFVMVGGGEGDSEPLHRDQCEEGTVVRSYTWW